MEKLQQDIIENLLQPVIQPTGEILALLPESVMAALEPLREWILKRNKKYECLKVMLDKMIQTIPVSDIIQPPDYIAEPLINALSYSIDSQDLRKLYMNLLARAMTKQSQGFVHPSFIEIIKQLSPLDAAVFKMVMERGSNPIVQINLSSPTGYIRLATNVTDIAFEGIEPVDIGVSIDNLNRLGLIEIQYRSLTGDETYRSIQQSQFYKKIERDNPPKDGYSFDFEKNLMHKTNWGLAFYKICVLDWEQPSE